MQQLINIQNKDGRMVVSSREVADNFRKQHKDVLESIRNLAAENSAARLLFIESTYKNRGKSYPEYLLTRDGFSLLVMGFTGKEALDWKLKYIDAFNKMEERLLNQWAVDEVKLLNAKSRAINAEARAKLADVKRAELLFKLSVVVRQLTDETDSRKTTKHEALEDNLLAANVCITLMGADPKSAYATAIEVAERECGRSLEAYRALIPK